MTGRRSHGRLSALNGVVHQGSRSPVQGRPLAVIPFAGAVQSCVIAANTMAKRAGVTTGMAIAAARRRCPGIALVPQQPDLYTRIHHRIVAAVLDVLRHARTYWLA